MSPCADLVFCLLASWAITFGAGVTESGTNPSQTTSWGHPHMETRAGPVCEAVGSAPGGGSGGTCEPPDATSLLQDYATPGRQGSPSILFLLVDDLGYGDVDICHDDLPYVVCPLKIPPDSGARKKHLKTPRMKQMAAEGQIFTHYYSPRSICSPSRQATLSGRDPVRYRGIDQYARIYVSSGARGGFPTSETTVAQYLKRAGYKTGYSGKWHMGLVNGSDPWHYAPWRFGFDEVEFFIEGSNGEPCEEGRLNPPGDDNIYHMCSFSHISRRKGDEGELLEQPIRWENVTARHLDVTLDFIKRQGRSGSPWFYMHAFTAVHMPWNPSRYFVTSDDPMNQPWTDMVNNVDWAVGVLLDELKRSGQANNTIVHITSDNGPYLEFASSLCPVNCKYQRPSWQLAGNDSTFGCRPCGETASNAYVSGAGSLSGGKGQTREGGQRVPSIWWWPNMIPAGTVNPDVSSSLDVLPTLLDIVGVQPDPNIVLDGKSLKQSLLQRPAPDPGSMPQGDFYYWCGVSLMALRINQYKVTWHSQRWVDSQGHAVNKSFCGGSGQCCVGSFSRLCTCGGPLWHISGALGVSYVEDFNPPRVVDLLTNPGEDFSKALGGDEAAAIVRQAEEMKRVKLISVATDLNVSFASFLSTVVLESLLQVEPSTTQVDLSAKIPPALRMPEFGEYQNCAVNDALDPACKQRFPCLLDEAYPGPWEYWLPNGSKCGGFRQPSGNSDFPEHLLPSVRAWQEQAQVPLLCVAGDASQGNVAICNDIAAGVLNKIPTGELWNKRYPIDSLSAS